MFKIMKYLKESAFSVLLIFVFLVIQAMCDLTLPDYTSKIVNVGIQQGGIDNVAIEAIRKSEMEKIEIFLDDESKNLINDNYDLIQKDSIDYEEYKKKYSILENEPIYVLNTNNKKDLEQLNDILAKPMAISSMIFGESEESKKIGEQIVSNLPEQMQQMPLVDVFKTLSEEYLINIKQNINEKFDEIPESIIMQSAVAYVKSECEIVGLDMEKIQSNYIFISGAKMLALALGSALVAVGVVFISSRVSGKFGKKLRGETFSKVLSFSETEFKKYSTASLITRSTNDIQQVQMLTVFLFRVIFYAPIIGIGGVLKVINTNTAMSWIIAVAILAIISLVIVAFSIAMPKFKIAQKLIDKLNLVSREIISGISVIRAFSTQKHEEERFDKANKDLTKVNLFVNRVMSFMMPAMMFTMNMVIILIVWVAANSIDAGTMQVGDMMAFIQYTMQIIMAFLMISMVSIMLPRASVSAKRINEILETNATIKNKEVTEPFKEEKRGYVEFKNVSFRYPDAKEDVISNISFVAKPGETTAFIGSTGSGKSSIVNLIPRFFDVTEGSILVDGVDIRDVKLEELRSKIGYVPQKGLLFTGTIENNIKYGNDNATIEDVKKSAKIAQATEFIDELPEKYETEISQGGTNVSGGQRQRISIARALAVNPKIYIFDDSFSALDLKTDAMLRAEIKDNIKDATMIIVAQRVSTIMNAEQIIVLNEGKIVGKGTHSELLKNCSIYREIAQSQLTEEELENE